MHYLFRISFTLGLYMEENYEAVMNVLSINIPHLMQVD